MDKPLSGIAVVDLTWNLPGPYASFLLADLGATVTRVEPPKGDPARAMPGLFAALNRGKASITLDLRSDDGKARLAELVRGADVVLEGFRPGVAERLGCSADQVRAINPAAIYCSISAYGQAGPLRDLPGHDLDAQALAGVCHLGRDAHGHPHGLPLPVADLSASMAAAASVVAALYARDRGPRGERGATLDVAMLDGAVSWAHVWSQVDLAGDARARLPRGLRRLAGGWLERIDRLRLHALPHYGTFRCSDGRYVAIGIVDENHFWRALCEELGAPRLGGLPMASRAALGPALRRWIAIRLRTAPSTAWLSRLAARDIPVAPVLDPAEALRHPHVAARLVDPDGVVRAPLAR